MSINTVEMVGKLNMVLTARRFKEKGFIEEYPTLPATPQEEEDIVRDLVHVFLKKTFVGCKIRANALTFSLRLDGHIHRKANKIREIYNDQQEWRSWFENNHSRLYRTMRENRNSFANQTGLIERREEGDRLFLYIPFKPNRIYGYVNHGLSEFCQYLENEYQRDEKLSAIYDEVLRLMEQEITRREQEKRERIARELLAYTQNISRKLFRPIAELQESEDAVDRSFALKFSQWARENGFAPEYAVPATAQEMVVTGMKVCVMAPPESQEEGWLSLPPFPGFTQPEGLELQGWGDVTAIDFTGERSRGGSAPIVIKDYMYTEFHLEHWQHLLPANYAELLEVSQRLRREAEADIEPWLEQERIRKEREEAEARAREEEAERQREIERLAFEEEIRRQVAESEERERRESERRAQALQAELERINAQQARDRDQPEPSEEMAEVEATEEVQSDVQMTDAMRRFIEQVRQQTGTTPTGAPMNPFGDDAPTPPPFAPAPEAERATEEGLYRNGQAIPLERYVAITTTGNTRRFRTAEQAVTWLGHTGDVVVDIRDYHAPHELVERFDGTI